jgi:hypothetical protein
MSGQKTIKVSEVLNDLKNGLTREKIGEKYGLNKAQVARLFQHEKLKYKKTILPDNFVVEDDTEEAPVAPNQLELELQAGNIETPVAQEEAAPVEEVAPVTETPVTSTWDAPVTPEIEAAEAQADAHSQLGMNVEDDTTVPA